MYKRQSVHRSNQSIRFQTLHHGQDQRAVQGCQDCRPTQGWNGLQDHRQAAWWEGDNSWCEYSQMEETQNNCQSPSDWGSMQDLTSWSFNDHENGEESAQNYTAGSCQWSQGSWDQLVTHYAVKDWNPAQESTCTGPSEVCQWFRVDLGESVVVRWDQNPALWHQLNSQCLEEEECCLWPQEHHPHRQTWRWKHYALGVFFC